MRPTLRCVLVATAGFPISIMTVMVSSRLWTLWVGYVGVVLLITGIDALISLPRRRVEAAIRTPEMLYVGDSDDVTIEVKVRAWKRPARIEMLVDLSDELRSQPPVWLDIPADETVVARIPLTPRKRGMVAVDKVWLRWTGPFGLMARHKQILAGKKIAVVPNVRAVRAAALRFFSAREFLAGLKVERYVGDGSEFESLREYTPGLDHRAMDWKASARHRKLLCQEFRAERNHQVVFAFDTGQLMSEPLAGIPKLDHAINAGLLLSYFCLRTGDRVGIFGFDSQVRCYLEPSGGMQAFPRVQRQSSDLEYQHHETNFTLGLTDLSMRLRRRSLIILLTDFVDTITAKLMLDNIQRLSRRHVVVFVTLQDPGTRALADAEPRTLMDLHRSVVAGDFTRERDIVIQRLKRLGVHCIDTAPGAVSMNLLNRYLDIKRRELI